MSSFIVPAMLDIMTFTAQGRPTLQACSGQSLAIACAILAGVTGHMARAADGDAKCNLSRVAHLPVQMEGPRASVPVTINGKDMRLWLDTGAWHSTMSDAKAAELGLKTEPLPVGFVMTGIGGSFTPTLATVKDFGLVGYTLHGFQFIVGGSDPGNGLLGANLFAVTDSEFDLANGQVNLLKAKSCHQANLAYWSEGKTLAIMPMVFDSNFPDRSIMARITINGHAMTAQFDTGAPTTALSRRGAQKAGILLNGPGVADGDGASGFGRHSVRSWIATIKEVDLNGEQIRNTPMEVIDDDLGGDTDLLIGADFFLSHHVLVARSQRQIYATYNGGPVFNAMLGDKFAERATRAEAMTGLDKTPEPKTLDDFAGRGSARLAGKDLAGAIADFTRAIELGKTATPAIRARLLSSRAMAHLRSGEVTPGEQDLDAALALTPNDPAMLLRRAAVRIAHGERAGAATDVSAAATLIPPGSLDMMKAVTLYERLGMPDRGLAVLDRVIALHRDDSSYAELLNARCWNRGLANTDLDRALSDCNSAIRRSNGASSIYDSRALVQLRRKDYAGAIADANAALAKSPDLGSSLFFRALARLQTGDKSGADVDLAAARAAWSGIDRRFAPYGLIAPGAPKGESDDQQDALPDD